MVFVHPQHSHPGRKRSSSDARGPLPCIKRLSTNLDMRNALHGGFGYLQVGTLISNTKQHFSRVEQIFMGNHGSTFLIGKIPLPHLKASSLGEPAAVTPFANNCLVLFVRSLQGQRIQAAPGSFPPPLAWDSPSPALGNESKSSGFPQHLRIFVPRK